MRSLLQTMINMLLSGEADAVCGGQSRPKPAARGKLVEALGINSLPESQVSRMAAELDEQVASLTNRPLADASPFTFVAADALTLTCPRRWSRGQRRGSDRHRGQRRWSPRGPGPASGHRRERGGVEASSSPTWLPAALPGCVWSPVTPTQARARPSPPT